MQMRHVTCAEEGGSAHSVAKRSQARSLTIRNQARGAGDSVPSVVPNKSINKALLRYNIQKRLEQRMLRSVISAHGSPMSVRNQAL